jgi:hypothetical protein
VGKKTVRYVTFGVAAAALTAAGTMAGRQCLRG